MLGQLPEGKTMNAITKTESTALAPMTEQDLMKVLQSSLYPGAAPESIKMVLGYCRAAGLDPMLKPVHIVPMYAATGDKDQKGRVIKATRDVIMPGIGLYRIQAARTGQYAGQDAPVFGPMVEATFQVKKTEWRNGQATDSYVEKTIAYPEWCSITIYRLIGGFRSAFTAVEFWTENYATAGRDTDAPNEMWSRRVRGQLSKCVEAQALRKAFPEVGQAPTAEEMEGRHIDADPAPEFSEPKVKPRRAREAAEVVQALAQPDAPVVLEPVIPAAEAEEVVTVTTQAPAAAPQTAATPATSDEPLASAGECMNVIVTARAKKANLPALLQTHGFGHLNPDTLTGLTKAGFKTLKGAM